jgi:hypothetical protein
VDPGALARLIAKAFLVPLLLGMLLRPLLPAAAERLSEGILAFGGVVLSLAGLALLAMHGRLLMASGLGPLLALLGMTVVALAIGHLIGGSDPGDRAALAVSCASRHVGIAMLAAASVPGPKTAALALAYVLASVVVSAVYLRLRARPARRDTARDTTVSESSAPGLSLPSARCRRTSRALGDTSGWTAVGNDAPAAPRRAADGGPTRPGSASRTARRSSPGVDDRGTQPDSSRTSAGGTASAEATATRPAPGAAARS